MAEFVLLAEYGAATPGRDCSGTEKRGYWDADVPAGEMLLTVTSAMASGLAGGVPFGFNIGYGFGDTSAASENVLFYNGKIHKLSRISFEIPQKDGKDDYLSPWRFTSDDGRFEMSFEPVMDRSAKIDLFVICSDQHQVFGRFSGTAVLDDGRRIEISDFMEYL